MIISTHCHNDLGLAVANSLSAIQAGARQIEGAINGLGERAGNTSTEEIIMAVKTRQDYFGVEVGADTTEIFETSRLVSRLTGYPIQYNKAIVGRNAFAHESGIHQHGVLRNRETYEIMDPASIGHASTLVLGKHSGRAAFADALAKMEIHLEDDDFKAAFDRFKELADRKGEISEEGIRAIVTEKTGVTPDVVELVDIHVSGGNRATPVATVTLRRNGEQVEARAEGDGMVNAAFAALQKIFEVPAVLLDYRVSPLTSGADAIAEVNAIIQVGLRHILGAWTLHRRRRGLGPCIHGGAQQGGNTEESARAKPGRRLSGGHVNGSFVLLPGDGIGPEVTAAAHGVLVAVADRFGHEFEFDTRPIGGNAIDEFGDPLPESTLEVCRSADAVILGAVGGPKWDDPNAKTRPEAGLLRLRKELGLFANLRPITAHRQLLAASPLRRDPHRGCRHTVFQRADRWYLLRPVQPERRWAGSDQCHGVLSRGDRAHRAHGGCRRARIVATS